MKLYTLLKDKDFKTIKVNEVVSTLKECGVEDEFFPFEKTTFFKSLVFYIVHAYSFESTMMDTENFSESLKLIEEKFSYYPPQESELKDEVDNLIAWYLQVQRNRDFELLINGNILYKQMISACVSEAILTKKGEIENIDYATKYSIYRDCIELSKELTTIEDKLEQSKGIIEGAAKANPKVKNRMKRIEEV